MDLRQFETWAAAGEARRLAGLTEEGWMKFVVGTTMAKVMRAAGVPESQIIESKPLPTGHP